MQPGNKFTKTIKNLPQKPGVYRYYSANNEILYIGKAKNLKNRVSSYFQSGRSRNERLTLMISQIDRIEYTVVDTEAESLILEASLINSHKPRYNVLLKNDKNYIYIRFTNDEIPTILLTRYKYDPNCEYFGPYTTKYGIYQTLQTIRTIFPFCQVKTPQKIPCNYYQIKQCDGICAGYEDIQSYKKKLDQIKNILHGNTKEPQEHLQLKTKQAVEGKNFELAALYRDKLTVLKNTISDQKIILQTPQDIDLITLVIENKPENSIGSVFVQNIRSGKIINVNNFLLSGEINSEESVEFEYLQRFLQGYFDKKVDFVEVLTQIFIKKQNSYIKTELSSNQIKLLKSILKIKIYQRNHQPTNKAKITELLQTSKQNAIIYLERNKLEQQLSIFEENNLFKTVVDLQQKLNLQKIPRRIECYDISHLSGKFVYGSMVVFLDGRVSKKNYKLFKTKEQNNDFENHKEVLRRRFERCYNWLIENPNSDKVNPWKLPDLIIVDGGKGQLSSDLSIVDEYKQKFLENNLVFDVEICALAKRDEEIFLPNNPEPKVLTNETKFLVQRIRDEAHRFAITNNRKARLKTVTKSELDNINGIGPKTKQKLLSTFGSTKQIIDIIYKNPQLVDQLVGVNIMAKIKKHFGII